DRVKIRVTLNLVDNPILWADIKDYPEFKGFKGGNQGTNFSASQEEYNTLLKMQNKLDFSWVETHKGIVEYLKLKKNSQPELIELLKEAGCRSFNDRDEDNNMIPLEVLDHFTFFC